jgi:histone H3/H4
MSIKQGDLQQMFDAYLGIRISPMQLNITNEYLIHMMKILLYSAYKSASNARRKYILLSDIDRAIREADLKVYPLKAITISELKRCVNSPRVKKITSMNKSRIAKKSSRDSNHPTVSKMISQLNINNLNCLSLHPGEFKRLSRQILEKEQSNVTKSKRVKITSDALALLQLIIEREVLRYAAVHASVAKTQEARYKRSKNPPRPTKIKKISKV